MMMIVPSSLQSDNASLIWSWVRQTVWHYMRPALGQAPNKYGSIAGKGTEALHFFYALEDSRIATAHYGVQSHAVGGEPESTL
jgi:hypothetical protein